MSPSRSFFPAGCPSWRPGFGCLLCLALALLLPGQGPALAAEAAAVLVAPAAPAEADWQPVQLPLSRQRDLLSRHTGHQHRIFVFRPQGAAPAGGYPVLYALDGNAAFPALAMAAQRLADRAAVTGVPPVLVVAIGYPAAPEETVALRSEDYTPPLPPGRPKAEFGARQGGAERFLAFIEEELKPLIAAEFPVNPARQGLFGHSYGGLFTLYTLFSRPQAFSTYVAASPSLWYGDRYLRQARRALADGGRLPARVLITVGAREDDPADPPDDSPRARLMASRPMVGDAREMGLWLAAEARLGGPVRYEILAGENHGSVVLPSLTRALSFLGDPGAMAP